MVKSYCAEKSNTAYGEGSYGDCVTSVNTTEPTTSGVTQFAESGSFVILIPLVSIIILVIIATIVIGIRKRHKHDEKIPPVE